MRSSIVALYVLFLCVAHAQGAERRAQTSFTVTATVVAHCEYIGTASPSAVASPAADVRCGSSAPYRVSVNPTPSRLLLVTGMAAESVAAAPGRARTPAKPDVQVVTVEF